MRLRRRQPAAPPDRTHLHLEQLEPAAKRLDCGHAACIARNDQAIAALAGYFERCGVDLDDPAQLHAVLASLSIAARHALFNPFAAGPSLAAQALAFGARTTVEGVES